MGAIGAIAPAVGLRATKKPLSRSEQAARVVPAPLGSAAHSFAHSRTYRPGRCGRVRLVVRNDAGSDSVPSVSAIPPSLLSTIAPDAAATAPLAEPVYITSVQAPAPSRPQSSSSYGTPPWMWIGVGIVISFGGMKLLDFLKSKQQDIQAAAMQQMMKTMMSQSGMPPPPAGMPPGMPGMPGAGAPPNFGGVPYGQPPPYTPPVPTASTPPPPPAFTAEATSAPSTPEPSFTDDKDKNSTKEAKAAAPANVKDAPKTTPPVNMFEDVDPDAVESDPVKGDFKDSEVVDDGTTPQFDPSQWAGTWPSTPGGQAGGFPPPGAGGQGLGGGMTLEMFEKMLEDPNMQKMIYPYLPEGMRSPETFKWMLSNPEYRKQLESMLQNGMPTGMDPAMMDQMRNFDMNSPEVKQQFEQMGMEPADVMKKIMEDPELATAFTNPRIQAAIADCNANPQNIYKYQNDPEVMNLMTKITNMFPPGAGGMPF